MGSPGAGSGWGAMPASYAMGGASRLQASELDDGVAGAAGVLEVVLDVVLLGLSLALLPLSVLGAGAYIVSAWSSGQGLLDSLAVVALPIIAVQAGYFLGLTTRPAYVHLRSRLNIRHSERV